MKYIYCLLILLFFSCGEDKHTKDVEENTYYSRYLEIYNAYDSVGLAKTIISLDEYLVEFPNAQNAYIFKAWALANNNQINEIDKVFEKALKYDSNNVYIYQYWSALLLKDSAKIEKAKKVNLEGFRIKKKDVVLENNQSWILLFENKNNEAISNSSYVINLDTTNNFKYYRTAAVSAIAIQNDSLYRFYNKMAVKFGQKDSLELEKFYRKNETIFELYKKLK
tara:strand:+ start:96 stop:764 length:669 start_codon:yes stop_codon:yes gene_type:complete